MYVKHLKDKNNDYFLSLEEEIWMSCVKVIAQSVYLVTEMFKKKRESSEMD